MRNGEQKQNKFASPLAMLIYVVLTLVVLALFSTSHLIRLIMPYAIAYTIPMLMTALGGLYSERSGVTNLGLEGLMLVGYFACALTIRLTEQTLLTAALPLGLLMGMLAGALFSLLHAFASINLKADQVISGTAMSNLQSGESVLEQFRLPMDDTWKYKNVNGATYTAFRSDAKKLANIQAMQEFIYGQSYAEE